MRFSCRYSFINPKEWLKPSDQLYSRTLDQISWIDQAGFDRVTFAEHHFTDYGQLPSLLIAAAAAAVRTKNIRIGTNILVLPLHHPLRVAEDAAIVDILSNGRFDLSVAGGYRENEFSAYGMKLSERAGRMEESIEIIRKCWEEETFDFNGKYFQLSNVRMTPKPIQKPRPRIIVGASSEPAARRAARLGDDMFPTHDNLWDFYYDECRRIGREVVRKPWPKWRPAFLHIAEDPDREWMKITPHARYESDRLNHGGLAKGTSYGDYDTSDEKLRQVFQVVTPDEAVALLKKIEDEAPDFEFEFFPILPGMDVALSQSSLELFANRVMPFFKKK